MKSTFIIEVFQRLQAVNENAEAVERSMNSLRLSSVQAFTSRWLDPLMIDHMLYHGGWCMGTKCCDFAKKYNASVFYDKKLQLVDKAEMRQTNLLTPEKSSDEMKANLLGGFYPNEVGFKIQS